MMPVKKVVFSIEDQYKIAVTRAEELTKRMEGLKRAVENCKYEYTRWRERADTLGEVIESQMESGAGPQQVRGEGTSTNSNEEG